MNATPNPYMLKWARETSGLSLTEASQQLGIKPSKDTTAEDKLALFESGNVDIPKNIVLKMSKRYHRPFMVFYLEKPPEKSNRGEDFRTLPQNYSESSNALVDALVRDVLVRQSIVKSAIEDDDYQELSFVGSADTKNGIKYLAHSISNSISFDLDKFRKQPTADEAFKYLRELVEKQDIFVLILGNLGSWHTNINVNLFRGFTASDNIAPFIVINENDSKSAWCFTLLHEMTHLWLGQTGVSSGDSDLNIEKFCNSVASEILLPDKEIDLLSNTNLNSSYTDLKDNISIFSTKRNISSTMVAYRLYLNGKISYSMWERLKDDFYNLWETGKKVKKNKLSNRKGGPSYTVLRNYSLGKHLVNLVGQLIAGGEISTSKASRILGVSPANMQKLTQVNAEFAIG